MKNVLILTNKYPYYPPVESFLDTELEFRGDKTITIAPSKVDCSKRNIAHGIDVDEKLSNLLNNKKLKTLAILSSLINTIFLQEVVSEKLYLSLSKFKWALSFFSSALIVKKFLNERDDDVVYSYWLNYSSLGIALSNCSSKISRAHGIDLYSESSKVKYQPFQHYIVKKLDKIYCISDDGYKYLNEKYKPQNLHVSRLGIIVDHDITDDVLDVEKSIVINIVSCSYILPIKRLDLIFSWVEELSKYKDINWTHIGGAVPGLEDEKANILETLSKKSNVTVNFIGSMSNQDVIDYYSKNEFDFFINMSDSEGIPVSIMEALFFGIPVIARNVGGIKELINDNNGLFISESVNTKDIKRILKYKNNRVNIKNSVISKYSADKNYCKFWKEI